VGTELSGPNQARLGIIGAALLDGAQVLDLDAARTTWSEVSWQRFLQADKAVLDRTSGAAKVALLGSLPDFLATLLNNEYGEQAEALAASLAELGVHEHRVLGYEDGTCHDEGEARVPTAGEVEEIQDLGGIRHAGDHEADSEDEAAEKVDEQVHLSLRQDGG
jgi:hypothetical protein